MTRKILYLGGTRLIFPNNQLNAMLMSYKITLTEKRINENVFASTPTGTVKRLLDDKHGFVPTFS